MNESAIIYCDEAGYTGNDLLNTEQPYFVFGSVDVENSDAEILINEAIRRFRLQSKNELKGAKLIRSTSGRSAVRWLQEQCHNRFHLVLDDKLFAIAGKFVEIVFEPLFAADSLFLYNHDFHRFISNAIYYNFKREGRLAVEGITNIQALFKRNTAQPDSLIRDDKFNLSLLIDAIFYFCHINQEKISKTIT